MDLDVVTIGDPMADTLMKIHDAHLGLQLNREGSELCINYADKIPVDEMHRSAGGNCVNAALAAGKLGMHVAVYGVTGEDADGRWIRHELESAGVSTSLMRCDRKHPTNASTAIIFRGERTLFVWHQPRPYHLDPLPQTAWVYATSLGPRAPDIAALHDALVRQLRRRAGTKLAFSPGTHQLRMGAHALRAVLGASELLVLNRHEAQELTGLSSSDPKQLLEGLRALGPRTVLMTDGVNGSYGFDGERFMATGILTLPVVDRTGAGDAYGATLVSALQLGADLPIAMAWATAQAAFVVSAFGASPGLVGRRRLHTLVAEYPDLVARKF